MTRFLAVICLFLTLAGCAPRGVMTLLPDLPLGEAVVQPVFVATNRLEGHENTGFLFSQALGEVRSDMLRFARVDVSVPPLHRPGKIEWPGDKTPDPQRHFVARDESRYATMPAFLQALDAAGEGGRREVVLFVHGFNVNNAEAVYRLAQIAHDFDARMPVIAYSWPSAGDARGYVYDRDSVIFSRDDLETLLTALTRDGRRVLIVAHSMGGQLVMETLRQMSISGQGQVMTRLSGVALISPDIDEDVFLSQASRISPFPQPFMLMVSSRDRALNLAAFLTGKPTRLGSISDPERLEGLPVEVIDLSDIEGGDRQGHATAFTAPAAITLLRDLAMGG